MLEKSNQNQERNTVTISELMNSLFSGDVETTPDLFGESNVKTSGYKGEYIVQVHVAGGTIYELKTGKFSEQAALREVPFAIQYCNEEFGKVLAWNWKGEENILHTPNSLNQPRKSLKSKIMNYFFGLED